MSKPIAEHCFFRDLPFRRQNNFISMTYGGYKLIDVYFKRRRKVPLIKQIFRLATPTEVKKPCVMRWSSFILGKG